MVITTSQFCSSHTEGFSLTEHVWIQNNCFFYSLRLTWRSQVSVSSETARVDGGGFPAGCWVSITVSGCLLRSDVSSNSGCRCCKALVRKLNVAVFLLCFSRCEDKVTRCFVKLACWSLRHQSGKKKIASWLPLLHWPHLASYNWWEWRENMNGSWNACVFPTL